MSHKVYQLGGVWVKLIDLDESVNCTGTDAVEAYAVAMATASRAASSYYVHEPAADTAAIVTLAAAGTDTSNVIGLIAWSYDGAPTGSLTIEDGAGTTVFKINITSSGPGFFPFGTPMKGCTDTVMIITLSAGGAGVSGIINVHTWQE